MVTTKGSELHYETRILGTFLLLNQGKKRCNDIGVSGWYQIIPFCIFVLIFKDGEQGENKYGPNPKGRN